MWEGIAGAIQEGVYNNLSMLYNDLSAQRSNKWQKQLMDIQFRNQKSLDKYGNELQYEMWEKTNYPAQVAMLKEAGLNPALLYGKGGPGGMTGSQTGGSATGGNAPQTQSPHFMSISASLAQGAQIELMKAEANKANAEAENLRGVVREEATTRINKLIQETANEKTKNDLIKLEADIAEIEKSNKQYKLNAEINNIKEQTIKLKLENAITTQAYDEIVQEIQGRAVKQGVEIALQNENITKNRIEQEKLSREITIMATEVVQRWASLNLEQQEIEIKRLAQDIAQKELGLHEKTTKFNTSTAARIGQWTGIIGNIIRGSASISTSTVNVAK